MPNKSLHIALVLCLLLVAGCRNVPSAAPADCDDWNQWQRDSAAFAQQHYYTYGDNFVVHSDSLALFSEQPEEEVSGLPTRRFSVPRGQRIVVADIRMVPADSLDSVWLKVGTEEMLLGWQREQVLMDQVVPDDPISQFIATFSDVHVLAAAIIVVLVLAFFVTRLLLRQNAHIVHWRDIYSFYPTLLCLIVASAAVFYASIQKFSPDAWRQFYFQPTLNPLSVSPLLSVFLCSVWSMVVVGLAALDDVRHQLEFGDAILYLLGLAAVCAVCYIVFSLSTLYYIGYALLPLYFLFALWTYFRHGRAHWRCGNCGAKMARKGRCPRCGAVNE